MISDTEGSAGKGKARASCQCPFCDAPVEEAYPFCKACGQKLRRCPTCGKPLTVDEKICPRCKA